MPCITTHSVVLFTYLKRSQILLTLSGCKVMCMWYDTYVYYALSCYVEVARKELSLSYCCNKEQGQTLVSDHSQQFFKITVSPDIRKACYEVF